LERIKEARKLLSQGFEREREGFERGGQLWAKSIADASDGG
jgi:hypothetical protein